MRQFELHSGRRAQVLDITDQVRQAVRASGVGNGLCNVFVPHTTAAVILCENWDSDVTGDLIAHLEALVPHEAGYRHSEGNSQAHILSVMLGTSLNIPVADHELVLGKWQGVLFAEFDGPRERQFMVSVNADRAA